MSEQNVLKLFPWITPEFVQHLIENSEFTKDLILKSFEPVFAFKSGENFSSQMIALAVHFCDQMDGVEKRRDFIMKIAIQTPEIDIIFKECHHYEREIEMYTKILPALEKRFRCISQIAPRCLVADVEKRMLVFEDLRVQQFKSVDKTLGLDMEHLKLSLLTLAKWHAGTATLLLTDPQVFDWYKKRVDYRNAPMVNNFYSSIAKTVSNTIKHWPGYETLANKLLNIPKHVQERMYDFYGPHENAFNVITHGDMFLNNILFRHDENGRPIDIRFVDFPQGVHTIPTNDLVCLLYGSANASIGQRDREHLIQYYHSELVNYLKEMQFPATIPSLLDIQLMAFKIDLYTILIVLFIWGLRYVNKSFDGGFLEAANDDSSGSGKLYSHPECIEQLKFLLDVFNRRGYFDF